jgi:hypothetical protein
MVASVSCNPPPPDSGPVIEDAGTVVVDGG